MGLETGEWCRCRSLPITPPASLRSHGSRPRPTRHIPPSPLAGRGVPTRLRSTPPLPPLPGGARQGGRGVPGGKDRQGERKGDGRMRSDREERGERVKKKSRSGSRTHCRSVLNQLSGSLAVPCDGTGPELLTYCTEPTALGPAPLVTFSQKVSHPGTGQAQPCLASVVNQSWAAGWYGCRQARSWALWRKNIYICVLKITKVLRVWNNMRMSN